MASSTPRRRANAAGGGGGGPRRRPPPASSSSSNDNNSATQQARSITTSLLRTRDMMSAELDRVSSLNTAIEDDGAMLRNARDEHADMGGTMSGARRVMGRLGRQDVRDAVILRCAVAFYWTVVVYVLWTRFEVPFLP